MVRTIESLTENHKINPALFTERIHPELIKGGVKAIIFDLGKVLIDFDQTIAAKRIAKFTDQTVPEIFNFFFD